MNIRVFTAISAGLLAAACQSPNQQSASRYSTPASAPSAYGAAYPTSERACADFGFTPATVGFDRCVSRERTARSGGRVSHDYAEVNLTKDAQDACYSYGLQPRTDRYDRCVGREIDARHYRAESAEPATPPYRHDQYGIWVDSQGYRVDANGYRVMPQASYAAPSYQPAPSYVEPRPATTGQYAFRDEFGFRYDAQGNRIDRNGRIISPQTTTP